MVYSRYVTKYSVHMRTVLALFQNAGVALKFSMCSFFDGTVSYLGHTIRPRKLAFDTKDCDGSCKSLPSMSQTELRTFLGLCTVYRRCVPSLARVAVLMHVRTEKDQTIELYLSIAELEKFQKPKEGLMSAPISALP